MSRQSLRPAIGWIVFGVIYVLGLSFYKEAMVERFSHQALQNLKPRHQTVLNLFQASYYFYYDQQFLPGVRDAMAQTPDLKRVRIITSAGNLIFDSETPALGNPSQKDKPKPFGDKEIIARLTQSSPTELRSGFDVQFLMPAGEYGILYTFDGTSIRRHIWLVLIIGLVIGLGLAAAFFAAAAWAWPRLGFLNRSPLWGHVWGLRSKFLLTIVLINLITGGIVFFSLSKLQTREQSLRIDRESQLFAQFSTEKVIADFSDFFYFYYGDKFLPAIRGILATNENLVGISIINRRTNAVLFDSEQASAGPVPKEITDPGRSWIPEDVEEELRGRDYALRRITRGGEDLIAITQIYKNENQESLFYVRYLFSYRSLAQSIGGIRRQILIDLLPSMLLGLLVAAVFAQLLISPIRRLVAALKRVTSGDYEVSVELKKTDEIGELVRTFNTMTGELRKKKNSANTFPIRPIARSWRRRTRPAARISAARASARRCW